MKKKDIPILKTQNRGIAFDMDGVLIDSTKYHVKAWRETFHHFYNFYVDDIEIYLLEGVKGKEVIKKITSEHGIYPKSEEIANIHAFKRNYFKSIFTIEPISGILELIKLALKFEYKLALVTGTSRQNVSDVILKLDLTNCFQTIITGDDDIKGKPLPDPYLIAAERLGIQNNFCLVIENAPEGIKSAKAANMSCIAVETTLDKKFLSQSDIVCQNINAVKKIIKFDFKISGGCGPWVLQKI